MAFIESSSMIGTGQVGDTCNFGMHQVNNESSWPIQCTIVNRDEVNRVVTLMSTLIIDLRVFDQDESSNTDSSRGEWGNNQYRYSNLRQWLNSDAGAGEWYTAAHEYDSPPDGGYIKGGSAYQNRPGFLYHFSSEDKALLKLSSIITNLPTVDGGGQDSTEDLVFLPSVYNLGGSIDGQIDEDQTFQFFQGAQNSDRLAYVDMNVINNTQAESGRIPSSASEAFFYWTRTPRIDVGYYVYSIDPDGSMSNSAVNIDDFGVRPCFNIAINTGSSSNLTTIDKFMTLPSAGAITYFSPIHAISKSDQTIAVAIDLVYEGSSVAVYACNNAYDISPTWEEVTDLVSENSAITLTNTSKTSDNWGLQIKVVTDKAEAPYISTRGIAYVIMDDSES